MPPNSNDTGFTPGATARMMVAPVADSPVKVMPSMSGCVVRNSPAESGPNPCARFSTPAGSPAWSATSANSVAVLGVTSDGFMITVLPNASAGATFQVNSSSGRFHGEITPTTPSGLR
ncbi:hypothetical protein D3C72_2161000 [compost metagenome]